MTSFGKFLSAASWVRAITNSVFMSLPALPFYICRHPYSHHPF
jgi:hypothetical protein